MPQTCNNTVAPAYYKTRALHSFSTSQDCFISCTKLHEIVFVQQSCFEHAHLSLCQGTIWSRRWSLLHGQCELKGLLLSALDDLLPQLPLMLDTLELRLNMLLRNLEEPKHAVVSFLCDHVQDVSEALRTPLTPSLVNSKGHVLSTLLPTKKLNIGLTLVQTLSIIKAWSWENSNHLSEFHCTLGQGCHAVLQVLKWLLIHLSVQNIMDCIHLRLPVLLVHITLLLHLSDSVAVLLDVHLV